MPFRECSRPPISSVARAKCPLAKLGYSRDGKRGKPQIVFALLCDAEGRPIAVEVFEGNTADPGVLGSQLETLRERFSLKRVVLVGDRGLLTSARIREEVEPAGIEWITALRAPAIRKLAEGGDLQLSLFDERDMAEISSPELFPGERLIVCRNPLLAEKRALRKYKVGKHFDIEYADDSFSWSRNEGRVAREAALDGIYVIRTSVSTEELSPEGAVSSYKSLSRVERAFRSFKTVDLKIRPVHHRLEDRVRARVLLCMLAYYVEWHLRKLLAPLLFDDEENGAPRSSPVAPARRSKSALEKAGRKRTRSGFPAQSYQSLLRELATLQRGRLRVVDNKTIKANVAFLPTPLQAEAYRLVGVRPSNRTQ